MSINHVCKSKVVESRIRELTADISTVAGLDAMALLAEAVAEKHHKDSRPVFAGIVSNCVILYVNAMLDQKEVLPIIKDLQRAGLYSTGYEDTPQHESRTYKLENEFGVPLEVYTSLAKSEHATCRWVKVGEKTVPVMELKCDNEKGGE